MEQLNRIAIRGYIGGVKVHEVNNSKVARFSIVTHYAFKSKNGTDMVETMWHNVTAWEGRTINDISRIKTGNPAYVIGRLKQYKYVDVEGMTRTMYEIVAYTVEIYEGETLRYEM